MGPPPGNSKWGHLIPNIYSLYLSLSFIISEEKDVKEKKEKSNEAKRRIETKENCKERMGRRLQSLELKYAGHSGNT